VKNKNEGENGKLRKGNVGAKDEDRKWRKKKGKVRLWRYGKGEGM